MSPPASSPSAARPTVSHIIPVHNGARYLREALDSLMPEMRPGDDVIVIDDGSTDNSADVAESWPGPVRVIRQAPAAGCPGARNRGLAEARGEWICLLDSDDLALPHRLAHLGPHLLSPENADLVYAGQRRFVSPDCVPAGEALPPETDEPVAFVAGSLLAWRKTFECVGFFNGTIWAGEMVDWFSRVRLAGLRVVEAPGVVFRRRRHDQNLSINPALRLQTLAAVRQALLARRRSSS